MINYLAQVCGMILLIVILAFFCHQKKVNLVTEKIFQRVIIIGIVCLFVDISSVIAIMYMDFININIVFLICRTYLVSLVMVAISAMLYVYSDVYPKVKDFRKYQIIYQAIGALIMVAIYTLPIDIYRDTNRNIYYTEGPAVITTYITIVTIIIVIFVKMYKERKDINIHRRKSVIAWLSIWISAAVIQFLFNELLIVGFACALGITVVYLMLENPQANYDRSTGLFNQNALMQYIKRLYIGGKKFSLICVKIKHIIHREMSGVSSKEVKMEVIEYLSSFDKALAFKNTEDEVIVIFEGRRDMPNLTDEISERLDRGFGPNNSVSVKTECLYIEDCGITDNPEDITYLIRYAYEGYNDINEQKFVCISEDMLQLMRKERVIEKEILYAIENDLVEVYYQPIYSNKKESFTCAEALIRMRDKDGNMISPVDFIPVAEKNGIIIKLGEVVFEKVCKFVKDNYIEGYGLEYIEVNLSVVQCADSKLAEDYINIMEKYEVNPRHINMEITESASLESKRHLLENMNALINYGVTFSLDDFGTGQSNLNYIVEMPVDIVKFDKDMTNAYFQNKRAKYVMDAAIHMIHGMKLEIVSEGIETKEQFETAKKLGIEYIQGYYFSRPLPQDDFLEFLEKNNV